jgi:outer membrane receptor protein involved in Fe transport
MTTRMIFNLHSFAAARPKVIVQALVAAGLMSALPVSAQQKPTEADTVLPKVVITANKRIESQREVAGTVSVLQGSDLENRGAHDQEDSLKLVSGVQFSKGDVASNTITIRGIGTQTANEGSGAQQGPTGQYLEDVPMASAQGKGVVLDPLTWDLDRVEILRGPQGVLFGSGSLGGAVRYLFNKPVMNNFEASVKGEYAKVTDGASGFSTYGMLNAPLSTDTAAMRVVVFDRQDPGYIDNLGTKKKDANDVKQTGGRLLLTVKPTKGLIATMVASTQKTEQGDTFSVSPNATQLVHTAPNNSKRSSTTDFYSLTLDYDMGGQTLTSITGYRKNSSTVFIDDTELFASIGMNLPQVYRPSTGSGTAKSQELRIASNPGSDFSYVAGLFYQTSDGSSNGKQIDPSGAFGLTTLVDLTSTGGGTESAIFADTEYKFASAWSVGAGGRFYRTTTTNSQSGSIFGGPANYGPLDSKDSGFTPKLTLKYRFGENLWYALASKGYRYGGRNASAPFAEYKSDSLWNYETGLRLNPARGVQLDLTAFMLDWKDAQFTYFTLVNGLPGSSLGNVGKARSTGLEASLRYQVSSSLDFSASLASIDAKTLEAVLIPSGGPTKVTAPSGSRLPGTPDLQAAMQANVRFAGPFNSQGRFNATYTHVGDRVMYLGGNKPAAAYDTTDLGLSFVRDKVTLATGVSNLTNEKGVMSVTGAPAGVGSFAQYFLQRPRTMTVSLRYDY